MHASVAALHGFAPPEDSERSAPGLTGLNDEPSQMASGTVGKSGFLRLGFERRDGTTILADLDRRVPYLAQRALHPDEALPDLAHVFLITSSGCLLQGDRLSLDVALRRDARAHVTTQSATKIHAMDVNLAVQTQSFTLADGAYLEFLPEPLIPHRRSRFVSDTRMTIAPTATLLYAEIVQPGRKHHHPDECFGMTLLSLAVAARRPDGKLLFAESLEFEPARHAARQTGVMDAFDVFGNVILCTPPAEAERIAARVEADVDLKAGIAHGACRLPNEAGLIYKVLGRETLQVKEKVREFWGIVREEVTGAAIPPPYFWR
ncbi:MAG TPA: urease accessory protein UreD [Steroidobacteraceae bacterium]|nr:urease accessory protein UreD [Steroidobacteraceae bacterium]